MLLPQTIIVPLLGGAALNLDRQAWGPFMLSRPLVTGFVIGWLTGEIRYGAWMGLSVELLWLAALPLGGQLTPNAGLAVSAALIAWVDSGFTPAVGAYQTQAGLVVSFLTVPLWALALAKLDRLNRRLVEPRLALIRADLAAGQNPNFWPRNMLGFWLNLLSSLLALIVAVAANVFLLHLAARLAPEIVLINFNFLFNLIPLLGLLGMAATIEPRAFNYYLGGLLAGLAALSAAL